MINFLRVDRKIFIKNYYCSIQCIVLSAGGRRCANDCSHLPPGNHPSCLGCDIYVTCFNGNMFPDRKCATGLEWDNDKKTCNWPAHSTCHKVSLCLISTERCRLSYNTSNIVATSLVGVFGTARLPCTRNCWKIAGKA